MSTPSDVAPEPGSAMSEAGRLVGIFWEPRPVFEDLTRQPRFLIPLILGTLLALITVYAFSQQVGWDRFLQQALSANRQIQELPLEQQQALIRRQTAIMAPMAYGGAVAGTAITLCAIAGILMLAFRVTASSPVTFKQSLSITAYSWLPALLKGLISLVILYGNPRDFDLQNPAPFNPGWFLDRTTAAPWLYSLLSSIDVFTIWVIALLGLGFSVASKKMKFGKGFGLVLSLWLATVVVRAIWSAFFG